MALSVATSDFLTPTSTGNFSVTGVGFQPKAVILFGLDNTALGTANDIESSVVGFATSSTSRGVLAREDDNGASPSDNTNDNRNNRCMLLRRTGDVIRYEADFVSFDADGFTLNFVTTSGTPRIVFYIAIGGDDLTNAAVRHFAKATVTGNSAITGVGFQPDVILVIGEFNQVANSQADGTSFFLGCGVSSSNRWVTHSRAENAVATSNTGSRQRTNAIIHQTDDAGTIIAEADLVSLDADGFTFNYTTANGEFHRYIALALKGGAYEPGSFNGNTSTGNQSVSGLAFQPKGDLFASFCSVASGSEVVDLNFNLGAGVSSTERASMWLGSEDAQAGTDSSMEGDAVHCIRCLTDPSPVLASADFVSQDANGFTVDWDVADGASRQILFLAMGDAVPPPPPPPPAVLAESAGYTERSGNLFVSIPIETGEQIFDGALVAINPATGRLINWRDSTGEANFFLGIAMITDETGLAALEGEARIGDTAGIATIDVDGSGIILRGIDVAGAAATDVGDLVFATDENTFTTTATPGGNPVGFIERVVSAGIADIQLFRADMARGFSGI